MFENIISALFLHGIITDAENADPFCVSVYMAWSYFCFVSAKRLPAVCLECYLLGTFLGYFFVALRTPQLGVIYLKMTKAVPPSCTVILLNRGLCNKRECLITYWSFCAFFTSVPFLFFIIWVGLGGGLGRYCLFFLFVLNDSPWLLVHQHLMVSLRYLLV